MRFFAEIDPDTRIVRLVYSTSSAYSGDQFVEITPEQAQQIRSWAGARITSAGVLERHDPPLTLEVQQAELAALLEQKISTGVYFQVEGSVDPILFPTGDEQYSRLVREAQVVSLGGWQDGTHWPLPDGSTVPLTGADVTALFRRISVYRAACQNHAAALGIALKADLNTDLTVGWPDNN